MSPDPGESNQHGPSVIAFSNRLPLAAGRDGWRAANGGLVPVIRGALHARTGAWVGWSGGSAATPTRVEGINADLVPIRLDRAHVAGHYRGFANQTLWPLLHDGIQPSVFRRDWWDLHVDTTDRFAAAGEALSQNADAPPLLWVNDYQLMLLPDRLRQRCTGSPIGFFLHTPFPPASVFARLPWREELLRGVLGADLVGFQTARDADNFVDAAVAMVDGVKCDGEYLVLPEGRNVSLCVRGVSVDCAALTQVAQSERVGGTLSTLRARLDGRIVAVGIDRLDYTKGILERLLAIEDLLERRPDLQPRLVFIQIAVPSRTRVRAYVELRARVEREVGRINGRFTRPGGDVPIRYLHRQLPQHQVVAYMLAADVMVVTPLKDGMNLVAKEYVTVQAANSGGGSLVLSEFAGAADELHQAILCNPFDTSGQSTAIEQAIDSDVDTNRITNAAMAATVSAADIRRWASGFLGGLERAFRSA